MLPLWPNRPSSQDYSFRETTCHKCGKKDNIAKVCRGGGKLHSSDIRVGEKPQGGCTRKSRQGFHQVLIPLKITSTTFTPWAQNPYKVAIQLDGREITMEIDTGALKTHFPRAVLAKPTVDLHHYTTKPIPVLGEISVIVEYKGYRGNHTLHVVGGNGPSLLGRDWLEYI